MASLSVAEAPNYIQIHNKFFRKQGSSIKLLKNKVSIGFLDINDVQNH